MPSRRTILIGAATLVAGAVLTASAAVAIIGMDYRADIAATVERVLATARAAEPRVPAAVPDTLPAPVRRYFEFVFQGGPPRPLRAVRMIETGTFRRPGTTDWQPMTVEQYVSPADPAFVFTGTTPILPGVTARAMDAYVDGRMEMKVNVASALTVVEESGGVLDRTSLMRFVIESPLFPTALLPGEHLRWEPIDDAHARAVVLAAGEPIGAYRASFAADGRLTELWSETDGDRATADRFHGAGEVGLRDDYRPVDGIMVPHAFTLARRFGDSVQPFWRGTVERIDFDVFDRYQ